MMVDKLILVYLFLQVAIVHTSHFYGGTITWRPANNTPSGSTVSIVVRERWSWRLNSPGCFCNSATIAARSPMIGDPSSVSCVSGNCASWTNMSVRTYCTDFSALRDTSSGEYSSTYTIPHNVSFSIAFNSGLWMNNLLVGSSGNWTVVSRINTALRPDGYINSSPVAIIVPILYRAVNVQHTYRVEVSDYDSTDMIRCRWSAATPPNVNGVNECGSICYGVTGANLSSDSCTITFKLTTANVYAAVALQVEDFYDSTASTPMSSVPVQFLFYGYALSGSCTVPPAIIGDRPNRACIGVSNGSNVTEYITAQVYCPGKTITEFTTSSPIGMLKSSITNSSTGIYQINFNWIPTADQSGPRTVCAIAIDNTNIESNQWCITFLVDIQSPDIIRPMSSVPTIILQNQTLFTLNGNISPIDSQI